MEFFFESEFKINGFGFGRKVELQCLYDVHNEAIPNMVQISPKSGSVSSIIHSYKSVVSKHAHYLNMDFA